MLTKSEIKLLTKGLKFTPTPKSNHQELKTDIKEYTRKLRLVEFFHNRENDDDNANESEDLVKNNPSLIQRKDVTTY
jgi:hypothetical protein